MIVRCTCPDLKIGTRFDVEQVLFLLWVIYEKVLFKCHQPSMTQYFNVNQVFLKGATKSLLHRRPVWLHTITLQWRHNGGDSVSNHQPHDCLLNVYSGADQRKHESSASLAFVRGIHRGPVNSTGEFPAQMASIAENVSIWWRHRDFIRYCFDSQPSDINKACSTHCIHTPIHIIYLKLI